MHTVTLDQFLSFSRDEQARLAMTGLTIAAHPHGARAELNQMTGEAGRGPERLLRLPAVLAKIGYGRSHVLDLVNRGLFPPPVRLSPGGTRGAVAWRESEVAAWIASRPRATRSKEQANG